MPINVNNNNVNQIINDELNQLQQQYSNQIRDDTDYGQFLSFSVSKAGDVTITTDKGKVSLASAWTKPLLSEIKVKNLDVSDTTWLNNAGSIDYVAIGLLLIQAENLRRQTNRALRVDARETAFRQLKRAAKKLRSGAKLNFGLSMSASGLSLAMSLFSLGSTAKAASQSRAQGQTVTAAESEQQLASTQQEITQTEADVNELTNLKNIEQNGRLSNQQSERLATLEQQNPETRLENLKAQRTRLEGELKTEIKNTRNELNDLNDPDGKLAKLNQKAETQELGWWDKRQQNSLTTKSQQLSSKLKSLEATQARYQANVTDVQNQSLEIRTQRANEWSNQSDQNYNMVVKSQEASAMKFQAEVQRAGMYSQVGQSLAQMSQAIGDYLDKMKQADAKVKEAQAQRTTYIQDDATSQIQNAKQAIDQFLQAWQSIIDNYRASMMKLVQA